MLYIHITLPYFYFFLFNVCEKNINILESIEKMCSLKNSHKTFSSAIERICAFRNYYYSSLFFLEIVFGIKLRIMGNFILLRCVFKLFSKIIWHIEVGIYNINTCCIDTCILNNNR